MKYASLILAVFLAAGFAFADNTFTPSNVWDGVKVSQPGLNPIATRTGGETCALATVIPGLPYQDIASTSTAIDNYNYACNYSATGGKDVVYMYTPAVSQQVTIDLCNSYYDTKCYVYATTCSGTPIACNDDYCSGPNYSSPYLSYLSPVSLTGGVTYYIVVDGYSSTDYGTYDLRISVYQPCVVTCPTGAQQENEPVCGTNYVDGWNGGCNSTPNVFQPLCPAVGATSATMCGKSGTFLYSGYSYRDTDWFKVWGTGGNITATVRAEMPVILFIVYGTDCLAPTYTYLTGTACTDVTVSYPIASGVFAYVMVAPSVFTGYPCANLYDYTLTVSGIGQCPGTATDKTSWGQVKKLYR